MHPKDKHYVVESETKLQSLEHVAFGNNLPPVQQKDKSNSNLYIFEISLEWEFYEYE